MLGIQYCYLAEEKIYSVQSNTLVKTLDMGLRPVHDYRGWD